MELSSIAAKTIWRQWMQLFDPIAANPKLQRRVILVAVCIALLLDNMLYMVIVPIIPDYLRKIGAWGHSVRYWDHRNVTHKVHINNTDLTIHDSTRFLNVRWLVTKNEDASIGVLFASKAIVQLIVNPLTGTLIDRIGYDVPMVIGLSILFLSTTVFAFGASYSVMFFARSLQGVGSAFADTSGLAMIADRYTEERERSTALGIALAFISFGCLVAPPFGGVMYQFAGKATPFMTLSAIALLDGVVLLGVLKPTSTSPKKERPPGVPMWRLLLDPYIMCCAGALAMSNVSLAFLEPTIAIWMQDTMNVSNWQMGLIWLPGFVPHITAVFVTVKLAAKYPQYQWMMAAAGLTLEGLSCLIIPFCRDFAALIIPICAICAGIALVDTALLPMLAYLVDTRHESVYGSVYAIADISYSVAYAFGPIIAGGLLSSIGFTWMNVVICATSVAYAPLLASLRHLQRYRSFDDNHADYEQPSVAVQEQNGAVRTYVVNPSSAGTSGYVAMGNSAQTNPFFSPANCAFDCDYDAISAANIRQHVNP